MLTDILVIGSGGAGLRAAIEARKAGLKVVVVSKGERGIDSTTFQAASDWMAFAAALGHIAPEDNPYQHWQDILVKGGLLCFPEVSRRIAYEAPERLQELESWGTRFQKTSEGKFQQILSDGAKYPRACGRGAETGKMIVEVLLKEAERQGIQFIDGVRIVDLLVQEDEEAKEIWKGNMKNGPILESGRITPRKVIGAWGIVLSALQPMLFLARSVVLATGGGGEVFFHHAFPAGMAGDGYAMAFRAGVRLVNMEFLQIGPSLIFPFKFALSGVFWRLSPRLLNGKGQEFIYHYIPEEVDMSKAIYLKGVSYPFTVRNESKWVDIALFREIVAGRGTVHGGVYMDLSHNPPEEIVAQAAVPFQYLLSKGIDIRWQKLEFAPAIQHFNGGILINEQGKTSLPGLFAAGEVAGGQHGADRPGGNALADSQVYGKIVGEEAAIYAYRIGEKISTSEVERKLEEEYRELILGSGRPLPDIHQKEEEFRWLMWKNAGIVRTASGLKTLQEKIYSWQEFLDQYSEKEIEFYLNFRNLLTVGLLIVESALQREESRGTHYREDFPQRNDREWLKYIVLFQDPENPFRVKSFLLPVNLSPSLLPTLALLEG